MRRRELVAAGAAAGLLGCRALGSALRELGNPPRGLPDRWAWVHGNADRDRGGWIAHFGRLAEAGFGGVLVSGGDTDLLSEAAHGSGLAFHRWIWVLNRPGDGRVRDHHPEWFSVSREGRSTLEHPPYVDYYRWVCPTREPVREYLAGLVDEVAAHPGVDGVHLDYIRHPDVILPVGLWARYGLVQDRELPEFDFCYCEVCRETFRTEAGTDPLNLPDPTADPRWREFRWDQVTGVVRRLAAVVRDRDKPISAAVFPTPALARRLVRQAWDEWPLDAVFPMLYHGFYEEGLAWIGRSAAEGVAALPPGQPLFAGLYLPDLAPAQLARAVDLALTNGAAGIACFESGGLTDRHLDALRS